MHLCVNPATIRLDECLMYVSDLLHTYTKLIIAYLNNRRIRLFG
jgi:hypothetical protein